MTAAFVLESALLGLGLAMDAFSVSLANGLREPRMRPGRMSGIAGVYALFQYLMPLLGWFCVHTVVELFSSLERLIPWIAFALLGWIGGKLLLEGLRERRNPDAAPADRRLSGGALLTQGLATSIDALSVGFTIEQYSLGTANLAALIIGGVTFAVCMAGLAIGKKAGTKLSRSASLLGGVILIAIGFKIFLEGIR
ncbi:MAG: manganese efflux pump [Oscillospiraceae bacterium]|nr:manganese efflux pump [Oscillospiraceae bacterium]